ncbi:Putative transposable element, partial [Caligus rogercresseyi]
MSSERDRRLQVRVLLDSGQTPTEIACQLGISGPGRNRRNRYDRYLTFGEVDEDVRIIVMHGVCGLKREGHATHLVLTGYRLNAVDYVKILQEKFLPWVQEKFPDNNVTQEFWGAHAVLVQGDILFWVQVESKACTVRHPNVEALKTRWTRSGKDDDGLHQEECSTFRKRIEAIIAAN